MVRRPNGGVRVGLAGDPVYPLLKVTALPQRGESERNSHVGPEYAWSDCTLGEGECGVCYVTAKEDQ